MKTNDHPVHALFLTLVLLLMALLVWALAVGQIAPVTAAPTQPTAPTSTSSCWHPPFLVDQPSELVCSLRIPKS